MRFDEIGTERARLVLVDDDAQPVLRADLDRRQQIVDEQVERVLSAGVECRRIAGAALPGQQNGNNDVQWLKVMVDSRSREVFTYEPQIVPANRTAVPAP